HSLIGSFEDLDAATLDDVSAFFALHYTPDNAVLTVVGDFELERARELVRRHFGSIPRAVVRPPLPVMDLPALPADRAREVVSDEVASARAFIAFRVPPFGTGEAVTAAVCAAMFGSRKASILHRTLVRDARIATEVRAFTFDLPSAADLFVIDVTAHPGISATVIETTIAKELEAIVSRGVQSKDVARAIAVAENEYVLGLEPLEGRADTFSKFASYLGDPRLALSYADRLREVTADRLHGFVKTYLRPEHQVSLVYVPREALGAE
ncbi:MAG TPA: insulinase family protein, partial [Gemmatimonadaceae bacterium]|nr:insulinase family protein [Gemmatimonadaceae bacterium]